MYEERRGGRFAGAFAAFMTPMAVLVIIYTLAGIHPFGGNALVCAADPGWADAFSRLYEAMHGGSLAYSFSGGLGGELYGAIASRMSSPLWMIAAMLPDVSVADAMPIISMVQAAFAGLFAYLMLTDVSDGDHMMPVVFAVGYASGSLMCLSFLAPQFADAAVFLPLIGAGISRLCERGGIGLLLTGCSLYMLTSARLWSCMVIFAAVYFSWYCMAYRRGRPMSRQLLMLVFVIMLGAGVSAITAVPGFLHSVQTDTAVCAVSQTDGAALGDIFAGLFPGAFAKGYVFALIYCSMLTLVSVVLYFFNGRIFIGERQSALFFIIFILLSMAVPAVGWLWLGFTMPTGTVLGMSFVLCLFMSALAAREFSRAVDSGIGQVFGAWMVLVLMYVIGAVFGHTAVTVGQVIFSAAFLTLMAGLALITIGKKGSLSSGFCVLMAVLVAAECVFGGYISLTKAGDQLPLMSAEQYSRSIASDAIAAKAIAKNEAASGSGFYRVRGADTDGCIRVGASAVSDASGELLARLGISGERGFTPVTDALLGVKYNVSPSQEGTLLAMSDGNYVCARDNAMPIGYAAYPGEIDASGSPFEVQNSMISYASGVSRQLFVEAEITDFAGYNASVTPNNSGGYEAVGTKGGVLELTVLVPADGDLYMYLGGRGECTLSVAGQPDIVCDMGVINKIGGFERGMQITVDIKLTGERLSIGSAYFAVLDRTLTKATLSELSERGMEHIDISGSRVRGTIELSSGQILLTSIPYSDNWSAEIDGESAATVCAFDGLLGVSAAAGMHSVELVYHPAGLTMSLIISAVSVLLGMIVAIADDQARRRRERAIRARLAQEARYEAAMASGAVIPITDEVSLYRDRLYRRRPPAPYIDDDDIEDAFSEPDPDEDMGNL